MTARAAADDPPELDVAVMLAVPELTPTATLRDLPLAALTSTTDKPADEEEPVPVALELIVVLAPCLFTPTATLPCALVALVNVSPISPAPATCTNKQEHVTTEI